MWRLTNDGKLVNKLRDWLYHDMNSTIVPKNGTAGFIEVNIGGVYKALTVNNDTFKTNVPKKVGFSTKQMPISGRQSWTLSPPDVNGWRTINNTASGSHSYLTSNYINNLRVLTVDKKGTAFL